MDIEVDTNEYESRILLGTPKKKSRGIYYNPLLYCTSSTGQTYYFKYFKAYPYDHRMLVNDDYGEPIKCQCPKGKIHHVQCPWYNPDVIYIIDFQEDLSPSQLAAQQKIYTIYQNTIHNPPEHCGCGTAAEITYMSHNTGCFEFQYINMRGSHMKYSLPFLRRERRYPLPDVHSAKTRDQDYSLPSLMQRPKMILKKYLWCRKLQEPKTFHPICHRNQQNPFQC